MSNFKTFKISSFLKYHLIEENVIYTFLSNKLEYMIQNKKLGFKNGVQGNETHF